MIRSRKQTQKTLENKNLSFYERIKHHFTKEKVTFAVFVTTWVVFATIASQYIVALPMAFILGDQLQQPRWTLLYYVLVYALTLALVILLPPRAIKLYQKRLSEQKLTAANKIRAASAEKLDKELSVTADEMGVQHLPNFVDIGLAPVGYVAYAILAGVLTSLMSVFTWFDANEAQNVGFGYYITDIDRICAMLAVVFIAPIAEELVMRGWLYGKLRRKWGIIVAILITSLSFAVLHGQWNVGVTVFALSIVLCSLREITGTIWSGMLLHILSNGIAFYILYIAI